MRIVNNSGISQGTRVLTDNGEEIDLVSKIELVFDVDEVVVARIEVLKPLVDVEVLPENCHFYESDDLGEVIDYIQTCDLTNAVKHLQYLQRRMDV